MIIKDGIILLILHKNDGFDIGCWGVSAKESVEGSFPATFNILNILHFFLIDF